MPGQKGADKDEQQGQEPTAVHKFTGKKIHISSELLMKEEERRLLDQKQKEFHTGKYADMGPTNAQSSNGEQAHVERPKTKTQPGVSQGDEDAGDERSAKKHDTTGQ